MRSAFWGGSMVRVGSGFGPLGRRPKYRSTMGKTSPAFTPPTMATTMFEGT